MKLRVLPLLAACLILALLTGCAAPAQTPAEEQEETVQESQETVPETAEAAADGAFALPFEAAAGLNPYDCTSLSNRTALSLIYEPLFTVDSSFQAAPYLCQSYEVSDDGMTHTLTLRSEAAFSDGTALTAADAAASIQAAKGSAYYGQRLRRVTAATAVSDQVLTVTTDVACGTLDLLLNVYVVKAGTADSDQPVGTGPYVCSGSTLRRVGWWRDTEPPVNRETINLVETATPADTRDAFEYGLVDLVCTDPNSGGSLLYHSDYELWNHNSTVMQYIGFNLNSPVFVYSPVRAALTYAIDRDAIVSDTAGGFAAAAVLPASPYAALYDSRLADSYAWNPTAFEEALAASEIRDMDGDGVLDIYSEGGTQALTGTMIVCSASEQRVSAARTVVDGLNALGFQLTLKPLEYDQYVQALQNGNFDLYYGEVRLAPNFDLSEFFREGGSLSYGGIADSSVELLCSRAVENTGNAYDLHQKVLERGLLCPVLFKTYAVYSSRGAVSNLSPCLDGVFLRPMT